MGISQYPAASWESHRRKRNCLPRNDTSGGCGGAPELSSGFMPLCKAVTDRRYRRNWSVRFIDALYELQVHRRARLSAPLQCAVGGLAP